MEQAHADELSFVMNALDDVPVHLQLGDDGGGEGNPGGVQFSERDWLVAGLAQSIQHQLLLGVEETHRPDCRGGAVSLARFWGLDRVPTGSV